MSVKYFTLTEIIAVVTIMGIIAAAAAPTFFRSYNEYVLKGVSDQLLSDLSLARNLSITRAVYTEPGATPEYVNYGVKFGVDDYQINIYKADHTVLRAYEISKAYSEKAFTTVDLSGTEILPETAILFNNLGVPVQLLSDGSVVELGSANDEIYLNADNNIIKIHISPITGRPSLQ